MIGEAMVVVASTLCWWDLAGGTAQMLADHGERLTRLSWATWRGVADPILASIDVS